METTVGHSGDVRRGYLTQAFNSGPVDYLRMAYCLALSLLLTQSSVKRLSVLVERGQRVPHRYRMAFDQVLELSGEDRSRAGGWRVENYHRLCELSPYEETVALDADMLFFDDVSAWWDVMARKEMVAATALNYLGAPIARNPLRSDFYEIGLPDLHNGFLYFRSGPTARGVFDTMADLLQNWSRVCQRHFGRPDVHYSSDCALLLALRERGLERVCANEDTGGIPHFIHMKACVQPWPGVPRHEREWRKYTDFRFSPDLRLTIGGIPITKPFHYHVRDFVTDRLLAAYETRLTGEGDDMRGGPGHAARRDRPEEMR
jgi:hypothetical protein